MLTKGDDYPIHQTPEPIAYAGDNRNFYDRYFFNGYPLDGDVFFAAALGVYPALNVMDAAFSVISGGQQHNVHASRTLHMERMNTRVGPLAIEVVEPLQVLRLEVDDAASGVRAELTFTGRFPAIEEPRFTRRVGSMVMMDYTRLTQNGVWSGWLEVDGVRQDVTPERWQGTRDRSWGIRSVGMRDPQPNPYGGTPQFFWLWAPVNFPDSASFYHLNADAAGLPWNTMGRIVGSAGAEELAGPESELRYASGTRLAAAATIRGGSAAGHVSLRFEPRATFYMRGIGYGHPEWGHGLYHGELEQGFERYDLSAIDPADPAYFHVQAICDVELERGGQVQRGKGVLEQLVIGPYEPYGFEGLVDLAP
jgi:hypothetical protein